jgi:hypothetical protein
MEERQQMLSMQRTGSKGMHVPTDDYNIDADDGARAYGCEEHVEVGMAKVSSMLKSP